MKYRHSHADRTHGRPKIELWVEELQPCGRLAIAQVIVDAELLRRCDIRAHLRRDLRESIEEFKRREAV